MFMTAVTNISGPAINNTDDAIAAFEQLSTDTKLGLLWVIYDNMGGSITPAAPGSAETQFTQKLLDTVKSMEQQQQLEFMRDLVNCQSTEATQEYATYTNDNKLVFWYELAVLMAKGEVIPVPRSYSLPQDGLTLFNAITQMEFNEQITILRHAVLEMGPVA